jgi:hypothetical protein
MSSRFRLRRSSEPEVIPPIVHDAARSAGQPLDPVTRASMESRFEHDFSGVRIHADTKAALAARSIGALAYTNSRDIVFGKDRYDPVSASGKQLLAHELAHVVQQSGTSQAHTIGSVDSAAEREAHTAATAVAGGQRAPSISSHTSGTLQRSVAGDVGGAVIGAGAGALLGGLLGGPIGALVGGLLGAVAGLAVGDALSADKRGLTGDEKTEAQKVFGASLDYGAVKIAEAPIMAIGDNARTPFGTIYFPPGTSKMDFSNFMPWLIHELTHVWQYQHGVSVVAKLFWALHGAKAYDYGGETGLRSAAKAGKHFKDFQTEQQGDILRDYYNNLIAGKDTSAYDPFVEEVKSGGKRLDSRNTVSPASASAKRVQTS